MWLTKHTYLSLIFLLGMLMLFAFPKSLFAQDENPCNLDISKKAKKLFNEAVENLKYKPDEAYQLLNDAIKADDKYVEAYFLLGDLNYQKGVDLMGVLHKVQNSEGFFTRAEKNYLKVVEICPEFESYLAYFFLGDYYYNQKDYAKAAEYLRPFVEKTKPDIPEMKQAKNMLKNADEYAYLKSHPVPFEPKVVDGVCTEAGEYLPLISPDGSLAFYTQQFYVKDKNSAVSDMKMKEAFKMSKKIGESAEGIDKFDKGEAMPYPFNTGDKNQGGVSITIDNNHLYITICEQTRVGGQDYPNCDIFASDYVSGKWSSLRNLGPSINGTNTWESQPSISADGKTLYFSSIRPGNIGWDPQKPTCDIYKSELQPDGKWGKAINLGKLINTPGNEKSPFIHTDSQTLYFSSDGIFGLGGYDIFFSKMSGGKWTDPKNIGYPINTEGDDVGFIVSTNGQKAYFSSNRYKGVGSWDVFSFDLYSEARPEEVLFLKGELKDEQGAELKDGKIEVKNEKNERVAEGMVDKISGKYAIAIRVDKTRKEDLIMVVKKEGYAFTSQYIKADDRVTMRPTTINFEVKPIKTGETIKLNNIQFATASSKFDNASRVVLSNFAEFLKDNPDVKIAIHGHTDNEGSAQTNTKLSDDRARAVYDFLVKNGIDASRMTYKGFGPNKPIASNDTPEGKALNRRTEFVITSK